MSIRTVLVDDEPLATQGLQLRLQAQTDQLVQFPVPTVARKVGRRVELDTRQAKLLGEGGDRVIEALDMAEGQPHRWRAH